MQFSSKAFNAYLSNAVVIITWELIFVLRNISKQLPSISMTSMNIMSAAFPGAFSHAMLSCTLSVMATISISGKMSLMVFARKSLAMTSSSIIIVLIAVSFIKAELKRNNDCRFFLYESSFRSCTDSFVSHIPAHVL